MPCATDKRALGGVEVHLSNVSRFCGQPAILAAVAPRAEPEVGREIRLVRSPRHELSVADRAVMKIILI